MARRIGHITAVFLVALAALSVVFGLVRVVTVAGESMEPTYYTGDFAIGTPGDPEVGDVIIYHSEHAHTGGTVIHRVIEVTEEGYITQGDNNDLPDPEVKAEDVEAVVHTVIPKVGLWLRSPWVVGPGCAAAALALLWPSAQEQDEEREEGHVEE